MEEIRSKDNPKVKRIARLLSSKRDRDREGLFVLEGARLCGDFLASGGSLREVYLTAAALRKYPQAQALRDGAGAAYLIDESLARRMADTTTPQGVIALCEKLDNGETAVTIKNGGKFLLLYDLQDPGNLGTVLRTAEAFGIDGVFLAGSCPDPYSPKVLRSSMGGVFRLPLSVAPEIRPVLQALEEKGVPTYAAALTPEAHPPKVLAGEGGCAVCIGNEGAGLPHEIVGLCAGAVRIPMAGRAESLNAAMAAGILIWEMTKG